MHGAYHSKKKYCYKYKLTVTDEVLVIRVLVCWIKLMQKTVGGSIEMRRGFFTGEHKQMGEINTSCIRCVAVTLIFGQLDVFYSLVQSLAVAVSEHSGVFCYSPIR